MAVYSGLRGLIVNLRSADRRWFPRWRSSNWLVCIFGSVGQTGL